MDSKLFEDLLKPRENTESKYEDALNPHNNNQDLIEESLNPQQNFVEDFGSLIDSFITRSTEGEDSTEIVTTLSEGIEYVDDDIIIKPSFKESCKIMKGNELVFSNMVSFKDRERINYIEDTLIYFRDNFFEKLTKLNQESIIRADPDENNGLYNKLVEICERYDWAEGNLNPMLDETEDPIIEGLNLFKINFPETKRIIGMDEINSFRVYVSIHYVDSTPKFNLLFVDPHHLVIPSRFRRSGTWINKNRAHKETLTRVYYYNDNISGIFSKVEAQVSTSE